MRATDLNVKKVNVIPDDALEALARCLYPMMVAFFESEYGKREFAEWKSRSGIENLPDWDAEQDKQVRLAG